MTETDNKLIDLETRLAFQEKHILELSDALAEYRATEARNALLLHQLREEVRQLRLGMANAPITGDAASEPPPPHY